MARVNDKKLVSFSVVQETMTPEEIENVQFSRVHFRIYSADRVNAHNYTCSLKTLKKYADTIAGKPILAWYNKFANGGNGDFAGHEDNVFAKEYPVGFFPNEVKVTYEKDEDGTIYLCADGYIWNLYYHEIIEVFENYGGIKGVSCEMLVIESEMIEDTDIENILQYSFTGITLIGEYDAAGCPIKPAVDGCCGVLVTNSVNTEYEAAYAKAKKEFEKILYTSKKVGSEKPDSFFDSENKEVKMEGETTKNASTTDVVDNATQEVTTGVNVYQDTHTYDDDGHYVGSTYESHSVQKTEVKQVDDDSVEDNAKTEENGTVVDNAGCTEKNAENAAEVTNDCKVENSVSIEDYEKLKTKNASLVKDLGTLKQAYDALMVKCNSLEEYKRNKENEMKKNAVELALNSVAHILSPEQISEWRKEAETCAAENVDAFANKLKAFAFDVQEKNGVVQADSIRNSLPKEVVSEPADLWERIDKKYN